MRTSQKTPVFLEGGFSGQSDKKNLTKYAGYKFILQKFYQNQSVHRGLFFIEGGISG
jgi:hypothetical protein